MIHAQCAQVLLHASAVLDASTLAGIRPHNLRIEFGAKVHGAWHMLEQASAAPMQVLNLFSSLAAFSGSGGQSGYAAANGALDAWALTLQVCPEFCCSPSNPQDK